MKPPALGFMAAAEVAYRTAKRATSVGEPNEKIGGVRGINGHRGFRAPAWGPRESAAMDPQAASTRAIRSRRSERVPGVVTRNQGLPAFTATGTIPRLGKLSRVEKPADEDRAPRARRAGQGQDGFHQTAMAGRRCCPRGRGTRPGERWEPARWEDGVAARVRTALGTCSCNLLMTLVVASPPRLPA